MLWHNSSLCMKYDYKTKKFKLTKVFNELLRFNYQIIDKKPYQILTSPFDAGVQKFL